MGGSIRGRSRVTVQATFNTALCEHSAGSSGDEDVRSGGHSREQLTSSGSCRSLLGVWSRLFESGMNVRVYILKAVSRLNAFAVWWWMCYVLPVKIHRRSSLRLVEKSGLTRNGNIRTAQTLSGGNRILPFCQRRCRAPERTKIYLLNDDFDTNMWRRM